MTGKDMLKGIQNLDATLIEEAKPEVSMTALPGMTRENGSTPPMEVR